MPPSSGGTRVGLRIARIAIARMAAREATQETQSGRHGGQRQQPRAARRGALSPQISTSFRLLHGGGGGGADPPPTRAFRRLRKGQASAATTTTTACSSSPASRLSQPAGGMEDAGGSGRRRLSLSVSGSLGSTWPLAVLSMSGSLDEDDIEEASSHDMSPLVDTGMRTPSVMVEPGGNTRRTGSPGQLSAHPPAVPFTSAVLQSAGEGPDAEHDDDWSRAFHDMDDLQRCHRRGAHAMRQDEEELSALLMARLPHFRSVDQLARDGDGSGEPVYVDYLSQFVDAPTGTPRRRATTPASNVKVALFPAGPTIVQQAEAEKLAQLGGSPKTRGAGAPGEAARSTVKAANSSGAAPHTCSTRRTLQRGLLRARAQAGMWVDAGNRKGPAAGECPSEARYARPYELA
eukprot:SM000031S11624  [mRNA]  locus=s31:755124:757356:- [translate_table: standard]